MSLNALSIKGDKGVVTLPGMFAGPDVKIIMSDVRFIRINKYPQLPRMKLGDFK